MDIFTQIDAYMQWWCMHAYLYTDRCTYAGEGGVCMDIFTQIDAYIPGEGVHAYLITDRCTYAGEGGACMDIFTRIDAQAFLSVSLPAKQLRVWKSLFLKALPL